MRVHRILIAFSIVLNVIQNANAQQWTYPVSGAANFSGNVSIGSGNPAFNLHIFGTSIFQQKFESSGSFAGLFMKSAASSRALGMHFGTDGSSGIGTNSLRFGRYDINGDQFGNGWQANPVVLDLDAPDASFVLNENGHVGIGTTATTAPLTVSTSETVMSVFQNPGAGNSWVSVMNNTGHMNLGVGASTPHPYVWSSTNSFFIGNDGQPTLFVAGMANGSVGIGTTTPKAKLAVNGDILAKKVTVSLNNLPDYVFNGEYYLRPLNEVEQYIQQNHHLPEVPSAEEVKKDGLNLGDNQATLLKKIEELTLYVIEQNKRLEQQNQTQTSQQKLIEEQNALIRKQQERLEALEKRIKD